MQSATRTLIGSSVLILSVVTAGGAPVPDSGGQASGAEAQRIDLAERLTTKKVRAVNREVTPLSGDRQGVKVSEAAGNGVVWIDGTDFAEGTIEARRPRARRAPARASWGSRSTGKTTTPTRPCT